MREMMSRASAAVVWTIVAAFAVVLVCLVLPEILLRVFLPEGRPKTYVHPAGWARAAQYVMWVGDKNLDLSYEEKDHYRKTSYQARLKTNNYGFRVPIDFGVGMKYEKAPDERVVILTGGSAAYGVGATSNEMTIAGQLERVLNERQSKHRYRVFNFGMGGWVAYQEFLAVEMWGRYLQPDWIISMSGSNDGKLPYFHQRGMPGTPNYFHSYQATIDTIYYKQHRPVIYRAEAIDSLLRHSHLFRYLSNMDPRIPFRIEPRTDWKQLDESATWYFHSVRAMIGVCPNCKYILATQPISNFRYEDLLQGETEFAALAGRTDSWYLYYISRLIADSPAFATGQPNVIAYRSMATWEGSTKDRERFFNDDVHMNDAGQKAVAGFFASLVLDSDQGRNVPKLLPSEDAYAGHGIEVLIATYGASCKARPGNATNALRKACAGKERCEYVLDVNRLVDPAPGCEKDFVVAWRCPNQKDALEAVVAPEAGLGGKVVRLSCAVR